MITKHLYAYREQENGGCFPVATIVVDNDNFGVSIYNFDKDMGRPQNGFPFFTKKEGRRIAKERCEAGDNSIPECNRYIEKLFNYCPLENYESVINVKLTDVIEAELESFGFDFSVE